MLYRPLNSSDIRLITIHPSDDPSSPVICTLSHHDITQKCYTEAYAAAIKGTSRHDWDGRDRPQWTSENLYENTAAATSNLPPFRYVWGDFVALSYTWGDPAIRRPIQLNGQTINVTANLFGALQAFRSRPFSKAGWKIWIDALCINQGDLWERGTEVKRMGDIYKAAWTPVIWLGTAADASDQAYDLIRRLAPHTHETDQVIKLNRILKQSPSEFGDGSWRALHDLAARSYWRRAWIVQEGSLGRADTPVFCGDQELRFIDIYRMFTFLGRTDEVLNIYMQGELAAVDRTINLSIHTAIGVVAKIGDYQQETESGTNTALDIFSTIQISRSVDATDPRDKIYGLLALMPDDLTQHIHPDYTAPVASVYASFTQQTITLAKSLNILQMVTPHTDNTLSLPSWIPDFTSPQRLCSLGSIPHTASGTTTPKVTFSKSPTNTTDTAVISDAISITGFIADTIQGLGCQWANGWPASTCHPAPASNQSNPYGSFAGAREALWKTMVANRSVYTMALEEDYSLLLSVPAIDRAKGMGTDALGGSEDLQDLANSHLLGYCVRAFAGNAEFTVAGRKISEYFDAELDVDRVVKGLPELRHALGARDRINLYRRMFTTEKGFVGIGMEEVRAGDVVAVLWGCSVPVVLREEKGRWVVVGESYVHGLMEGEGLGMLERGEVTEREFEIW